MYETKNCDHCGKHINAALMICPFCGGHIKDKTGGIPPCCPRCKKPLVTYTQSPPLQGEGWGGEVVFSNETLIRQGLTKGHDNPGCHPEFVSGSLGNEIPKRVRDDRGDDNGVKRDAGFTGEKYELCQDCGGLWLDRGKFRRATRESDVYKEESLIINEYVMKPVQDTVTYLPCVRCGKVMNRKNFAKISGVIIDECGNHGVWLDAGELEKIRLFIADGGLERVQDREIEKNRVEIERLAIKVDQTAFIQRLLNFWNFKRWLFGG